MIDRSHVWSTVNTQSSAWTYGAHANDPIANLFSDEQIISILAEQEQDMPMVRGAGGTVLEARSG